MTGLFLRVKRDGRFQAVEIETMSEEELTQTFEKSSKSDVIRFLAALAEWIRDSVVEDTDPRG